LVKQCPNLTVYKMLVKLVTKDNSGHVHAVTRNYRTEYVEMRTLRPLGGYIHDQEQKHEYTSNI